ncbi:sensor histidine kinase [Algoriphagus pacificus]|uniref:histidine kinase n=1 Tax=Algoriphagus pacificus TaxID=2811234 RepID=A0ABS3CKQ1_9BACT|nr:GAF domain-containing sensor histidine kinase [Algoriphagus pacificus]MBN7817686.1 GAF domain-containing sensor histidine kinase [Algoriphagus pacificus]
MNRELNLRIVIKPETPHNENERIKALQDLNILDTLEEDAYDQLTLIASQICDVPIALITLVDTNRQWFKSHHGLKVRETPREIAFCAHAINKPEEILVVEDATKDERFNDNPLSTNAPNVIFYAGAPLNTSEGFCLGTLCVIDNEPKKLSNSQQVALKALADQVIAQLELRRKNLILIENIKIMEQLNHDIDVFSYQLSHDLQTPLRGILSIVDFLKEDDADGISISIGEKIGQIENRARYGLALVKSTIEYAKISKANLVFSEFKLEDTAKLVFANLVNAGNVKLELVYCDQIVRTSEHAIQVVFQNLMTNSLKFNDKDRCIISISLKMENNRILIDYKDNGPGISKKFKNKIFEIFETLNTKSENSTGIGLAIVKTVLNKLSGHIRLMHSEIGKGIHFKIELPLEILKKNNE